MQVVATPAREKRERDRHPVKDRARIFWVENGIPRQSVGEVRELSPRGMSCWVAQRMPAFTEIRIECHTQHLHGDAVVRHCNNHGARFLLGIEFRGSMTWRADGEVPLRPRWD